MNIQCIHTLTVYSQCTSISTLPIPQRLWAMRTLEYRLAEGNRRYARVPKRTAIVSASPRPEDRAAHNAGALSVPRSEPLQLVCCIMAFFDTVHFVLYK